VQPGGAPIRAVQGEAGPPAQGFASDYPAGGWRIMPSAPSAPPDDDEGAIETRWAGRGKGLPIEDAPEKRR